MNQKYIYILPKKSVFTFTTCLAFTCCFGPHHYSFFIIGPSSCKGCASLVYAIVILKLSIYYNWWKKCLKNYLIKMKKTTKTRKNINVSRSCASCTSRRWRTYLKLIFLTYLIIVLNVCNFSFIAFLNTIHRKLKAYNFGLSTSPHSHCYKYFQKDPQNSFILFKFNDVYFLIVSFLKLDYTPFMTPVQGHVKWFKLFTNSQSIWTMDFF